MDIPGVDISVLRAKTTMRPGEPVTVSGRVSIFGVGFPAFIRVSLTGPEQSPDVIQFDTMSSLAGDYSIQVVAEKAGRYKLLSLAFLPLGIPIPGRAPLIFGPSIGESPQPPMIVGHPIGEEVEIQPGQRISAPPLTPIEIEVGAPTVIIGGIGAPPTAPPLFFLPPTPPLPELPGLPDIPGVPEAPAAVIITAPPVWEPPPPVEPPPTPVPPPPVEPPPPTPPPVEEPVVSGRIVGFTLD